MTGTQLSSDGLTVRQRKVLFRAWHRGTREMDLLFGRFIDAVLADLNADQLTMVETLIDVADRDLFAWITGEAAIPADQDTPVFRALSAFHHDGLAEARTFLEG